MELADNKIIELIKKGTCSSYAEEQDPFIVHFEPKNDLYLPKIKKMIGEQNYNDFVGNESNKREFAVPITLHLTNLIICNYLRFLSSPENVIYHNVGKNIEVDFELMLSTIWENYSIETFVKDFLTPACFSRFNGFVMIERSKTIEVEQKDGTKKKKNQIGEKLFDVNESENTKPYIKYIDAKDVIAFDADNTFIEWILFKDENKYRFINDKVDLLIVEVEKNYYIESKIDNLYGITVTKIAQNKFEYLIPLLDRYLDNEAKHYISDDIASYPKLVIVGTKCPKCGGTGVIDLILESGELSTTECPICKGSKLVAPLKVGEVLVVPNTDLDGGSYSGSLGAWLSCDTAILEYQRNKLKELENKIINAATGLNNITEASLAKTATEVVINMKPLEDKLFDFIINIKRVVEFLVNQAGKYAFGENYISCVYNYSNKLNLRDINKIMNDIIVSKTNGLPLDDLYYEMIISKYRNDPKGLKRALLLANLEPKLGYTNKEVNENEFLSKETKILKSNFNEIIQSIEDEYKINLEDIQKPEIELKTIINEKLKNYVSIEDRNQPDNQKDNSNNA